MDIENTTTHADGDANSTTTKTFYITSTATTTYETQPETAIQQLLLPRQQPPASAIQQPQVALVCSFQSLIAPVPPPPPQPSMVLSPKETQLLNEINKLNYDHLRDNNNANTNAVMDEYTYKTTMDFMVNKSILSKLDDRKNTKMRDTLFGEKCKLYKNDIMRKIECFIDGGGGDSATTTPPIPPVSDATLRDWLKELIYEFEMKNRFRVSSS